MEEVEEFLEDFGSEFIPRSIGVTEEDDFIESSDDEYIKRKIRELYLTDSTMTILLVGRCSWSRKFIDWELSSSLRNDSVNRRNGLLAVSLPSAEGLDCHRESGTIGSMKSQRFPMPSIRSIRNRPAH